MSPLSCTVTSVSTCLTIKCGYCKMVLYLSFLCISMELGHRVCVLTLYSQNPAVSNQELAHTWDTISIGIEIVTASIDQQLLKVSAH